MGYELLQNYCNRTKGAGLRNENLGGCKKIFSIDGRSTFLLKESKIRQQKMALRSKMSKNL
jgi:hypothetical protein